VAVHRLENESMEQNTREWYEARLGMVTASEFKTIMVEPKGGGWGAGAETYMTQVIAEKLLLLANQGKDAPLEIDEGGVFKATEWGKLYEPTAVALYQLNVGHRLIKTGFLKHPGHEGIGGSPDAVTVSADGGAEIKCPYNSRVHLTYLLNDELPSDYHWQVHGLMWVTGAEWWDFVSFDPRMPSELQLFTKRIQRDESEIKHLERRVTRFVEQLNIKYIKLLNTRGIAHESSSQR
jgi:hypothetical protein